MESLSQESTKSTFGGASDEAPSEAAQLMRIASPASFGAWVEASPSREPVMFNIDDDAGYPKITRPTSLEARRAGDPQAKKVEIPSLAPGLGAGARNAECSRANARSSSQPQVAAGGKSCRVSALDSLPLLALQGTLADEWRQDIGEFSSQEVLECPVCLTIISSNLVHC